MKLSLKQAFLLSAIAVAASNNSNCFVHADESAAAAAAATEEVVADDAAKECTADDETCISPEEEAIVPPVEEEETTEESTTTTTTETTSEEEEDPACPSRPHVIRCAAKYLDTNQNGALEKSELETAMNTVPWILRSLLNIIGSVDAIMKKCDADGDGSIDIEVDMKATEETCLATCFKRKVFKKLFFPDCTE
jgi:hypothetical protein